MENEEQQGQTKACPKCKEVIQASAKKCKHCQADLRNWFVRHKILTGILVIFVIGIIASAGGGNGNSGKYKADKSDKKTESEGGGETSAKAEEKQNKLQNQFIKKTMGEEITTKTYKLKVDSAQEKQAISSSYGTPAPATEGAKFVVVSMDVTNLTDNKFMFSPDDTLSLVDESGKNYKMFDDTIGNIDNYLNVQDLSPNIVKKGVVVYEIPQETNVYDLFIENQGTKEVYQVKLK